MSDEACESKSFRVEVQSNGIIRRADNLHLIGKLVDDEEYKDLPVETGVRPEECTFYEGLRDQFAMAALTGVMSGSFVKREDPLHTAWVAKWSYEIADAMLEARDE